MRDVLSSTKRRPSPVSIRFSDSEKTRLREKAGAMPLGTYVKQVVLGDEVKPNRRRAAPVADLKALGQILGLMSQSRMANNLNQLAKAANLGALPVEKEVETDLRDACANITLMRRLLLRALGQMPDWEGERLIDLHARIAAGRPG